MFVFKTTLSAQHYGDIIMGLLNESEPRSPYKDDSVQGRVLHIDNISYATSNTVMIFSKEDFNKIYKFTNKSLRRQKMLPSGYLVKKKQMHLEVSISNPEESKFENKYS